MKIQNPKSKIKNYSFRTPNSELRTRPSSLGFTYIALLAAIVIIGISLGAAGKYWSNVILREKEEELLFRGDQYRRAIELYYASAIPGTQPMYPQSIDDLLKDNRTAAGKRHLRRKYKDPITGEDFVEFRDKTKGNRITGVYSSSDKEPLKQGNFPDQYKDFEGKKKYSEWKFMFNPQQVQTVLPGQPVFPGQPQYPMPWQQAPGTSPQPK